MKKIAHDHIVWTNSVRTRQLILFIIIMTISICFTTLIYASAVRSARDATYQKMYAQGTYFQQSLDMELKNILKLQIDLSTDRRLPFILYKDMLISDYDRREALLSVKERIGSICGVSKLIQDGVMYIPGTNYRITPNQINKMTDDDYKNLSKYQEGYSNQINYIDGTIFLVSTGSAMIKNHTPDYLFFIELNKKQLIERLNALSTTPGSGALIYNPDINFLEESNNENMAEVIIKKLNTYDNLTQVQRIKINNKNYLIFVAKSNIFGELIQYAEEGPIMSELERYRNYFIGFIFIIIILAFSFSRYTEYLIHQPIYKLLSAFEKVKMGNLDVFIDYHRDDEFGYIYRGFHEMEEQLDKFIKEVYVQKSLTQKAELKQLQAQINPHFLYNCFFTLSRRVKKQDYEGAQEIATHLGNYFKFLTRNTSDDVSLKQEVDHARSYASIQGARFISRLQFEFHELPCEYNNLMVPRLILQPIIENALDHGLDNKEENGILRVSFQTCKKVLEIIVEDNGDETTDDKLLSLQKMLENDFSDEITAIVNIHRRLNYYFSGQAGITLERSELGGIKTTIWINRKGNEDE